MHSSFSPTTSNMFSIFFKPKFYRKSKSYLDIIKAKVEIIMSKRNAVQKIFKNDIAELLRRGHDYSAYQRAAGLLMEYNKSSCYELINKYCGCVSNHLDDLSKQRDCSDECKEAVQTLIDAASRFGDLPELREIRDLFTKKYGNSFKSYLNHEFVSKSRPELPTRETTIRLLHDIAAEFSLNWDSNSLIQQIYRPRSLCVQERSKEEVESNKGEERGEEDISISKSRDEENEESGSSSEMWSQESKKTSSSSSSSSSVSEDDDYDYTPHINKRPFSSETVPAPYSLIPKNFNHNKVEEGNSQNQKEPKHKHKAKGINQRPFSSGLVPAPYNLIPKSINHNNEVEGGISVRSTRSAPPARHVHPKLPEFDDLAAQLSSQKVNLNKHLTP